MAQEGQLPFVPFRQSCPWLAVSQNPCWRSIAGANSAVESWRPSTKRALSTESRELSAAANSRLFPPTENSHSLIPGLCCDDLRRATICRMRVGAPAARSPKRAPPLVTRAA
jgi:hypothetical protein